MVTVDIFLADPIVISLAVLPAFDPQSVKFVYRLELNDETTTDTHLLEETFRIFNIDHPHAYHERSLSVGDVVTIAESRSYRCASLGWEKLERPLLVIADRENATMFPSRSRVRGAFIWLRSITCELCRWLAQVLCGF